MFVPSITDDDGILPTTSFIRKKGIRQIVLLVKGKHVI